MVSWTMAALSMFPRIFRDKRHPVLSSLLPHLVPFPLCSCLPLCPLLLAWAMLFLYYYFLSSKNIDGKYKLWLLGGGPWLLCPLESVGPLGLAWCGMSQWLSYCRSSAWPLIPQSGFVESGRGPALSKLTPTSLMQWNKIGLHLSSFVGGSFFLCVLMEVTSEWVWVFCVCQGKYVIFGGDICDPRYFSQWFP